MLRTLIIVAVVALLALGVWLGSGLLAQPSVAGGPPVAASADAGELATGTEPRHAPVAEAAGEPQEARAEVRGDAAASSPAQGETVGALVVRARLEEGEALADLAILVKPAKSLRPTSDTRRARTDAAGLARVDGLPPGRVSIWSPVGGRARAEIAAGAEVEAELVLKDAVDVAGRVVDARGAPVAGATIWVATWRRDWLGTQELGRSDAEGRFAVRHVSERHSLGASAQGHGPSELVDLEHAETTATPVELELALTADGGDLSGRVVARGGSPVAGALVGVGECGDYEMRFDGSQVETWNARVATTDAEGRYRFEGLPTGAQPVRVFAEGFAELAASVEIEAGAGSVLDLELQDGVSAVGVVFDESGAPVPDALVLALPEPFEDPFPTQGPTDRGAPFHIPATRSGPDGSYRLPDLPRDALHLHASKGTRYWDDGDYQGTVQESFTDVATAELEWNPVLSRGRSIRGRVLYADGTPMGNVFVSAIEPDTERRFTEHADDEGHFTIPALKKRTYTVSVQLWDQPEDAKPLREENVWPSDDELILVASYSKETEVEATLSARIVDSAGRITGKARLVFAHDGGWRHAREQDGVWSSEVEPGRYQARILFRDQIVGLGPWFDVAPGEVRDLGDVHTVAGSELTVRVRRPAGQEARTVQVWALDKSELRRGSKPIPPEEDSVTFTDLLEGPATVTLSGSGIAVDRRELNLVAADANSLTIDLVAGAGCTVEIDSAEPLREGFGVLTVVFGNPDGSVRHEAKWHEKWGNDLPHRATTTLPIGTFTVEAATSSGLRATGELTVESLADAPTLALELVPR